MEHSYYCVKDNCLESERNIFRDAYLKSPEAIAKAEKLILKDLGKE